MIPVCSIPTQTRHFIYPSLPTRDRRRQRREANLWVLDPTHTHFPERLLILRRDRGQENINFPCLADHEQDCDWQPYPVDPLLLLICDDCTLVVLDVADKLFNITKYLLFEKHPRERRRISLTHLIYCVCVCCHPIYSGRRACGRTSRSHTGGSSHGIPPPSFCGACLNFSREKDSAVHFPRRPKPVDPGSSVGTS